MARRQLGKREAEVLASLAAANGFIAVSALRDRLDGDPAYTTVNTILTRLFRKGLVERTLCGRHYEYKLAVNESKLVADRMHEHLRYAHDPSDALGAFVQNLSVAEAKALREILAGLGDEKS
ncbi:BlaI/MecI/CopY family transcriptional regulator [Spirillospora sp. NPDC047279]|uniref:BlaI/MecI/CopY family transcriptional regulator n=1 Tax=Spirillospora sp. NPDC047279 TaxID=3155478 RepID=UPI0033E9261B